MKEHQTIFSVKELKNKVKNAFVNGIPDRDAKIKLIFVTHFAQILARIEK